MVTGTDLVVEQIRVAAGQSLSDGIKNASQRGHAIECRLYAEDGDNNFMPSSGEIHHYSEPTGPGVRVDSGIMQGMEITIDYDPIMAKLIVHAPDRESAIVKMIDALHHYKILGVKTSKRFMVDVLNHPEFHAGRTYTNFIENHMSDRDNGQDDFKELAAAVAAVAAGMRPSAAVQAGGGGKEAIPSPWQLIGQWQIGDSIHG
jgi:acetyl-CoA carboxylase biotin carboxylase subunit